jgi:hypothetical protein
MTSDSGNKYKTMHITLEIKKTASSARQQLSAGILFLRNGKYLRNSLPIIHILIPRKNVVIKLISSVSHPFCSF